MKIAVRTPTAPESPATGGVEILELPLEPIDRARAVLEAGGSPRAMIEAFERGGALPSRVIEAQASIATEGAAKLRASIARAKGLLEDGLQGPRHQLGELHPAPAGEARR